MIGKDGEVVCPEPQLWHEIHLRLEEAARSSSRHIIRPPRPLVLDGWWGSSDFEKKKRWESTLAWAKKNGFDALIGPLPDDRMHKVDPITFLLPLLSINPFPNRKYRPSLRPTYEEISRLMHILTNKWSTIAVDVADLTRPICFTGRKQRRLLVEANADVLPPWGQWDQIARGKGSSFTALRRSVNDSIAPHEVDHIDFLAVGNFSGTFKTSE